jgi:hypothetical protein
MRTRSHELWLAALAIFLITLLYLGVVARLGSVPAAQSFFGHSLGVVGFLMMLMTETLYSLRKRSRTARWGRMAAWLQFHIFTGLVGPYLVLLHTSWEFNGLAGVVLLLTVVIVASGFVGRYIYTAVPRTADGAELQARELGTQIQIVEELIQAWLHAQPRAAGALSQRIGALQAAQGSGRMLILGRFFSDLAYRWDWWREQRRLDQDLRAQAAQLERLVGQQRSLQRQMASLAAARRMLAAWHAIHIPIGMALFTAALVHVIAALYYATLIR